MAGQLAVERWLTTSGVARKLELTEARIIQLANAGVLPVAARTAHGRLFDPDVVARIARERELARAQRNGHANGSVA